MTEMFPDEIEGGPEPDDEDAWLHEFTAPEEPTPQALVPESGTIEPESGTEEGKEAEMSERHKEAKLIPWKCMDEVDPVNPEWLWTDRIPKHAVTVIEGHPGVGKSSVIMDLAARMSTGEPWPDEDPENRRDPMRVLWVTMEDSVEHTLVPRLLAAEGDGKQVFVASELPILAGVAINPQALESNRASFGRLIAETSPDVLILDPGSASLEDGNSEPIARQCLGRLYQLGEARGVTTIWIRHMAKSSGDRSPLMAGIGSIGVAAAARSVLQLIPDEEKEERNEQYPLHLCHIKSNLSEKQPTLTCEQVRAPVPGHEGIWSSRIVWGGESPLSARALNQKNTGTNKARVPKDTVYLGLETWFQKKGSATGGEIVDQINALGGTNYKDLNAAKSVWQGFLGRTEIKTTGRGPTTKYEYSDL